MPTRHDQHGRVRDGQVARLPARKNRGATAISTSRSSAQRGRGAELAQVDAGSSRARDHAGVAARGALAQGQLQDASGVASARSSVPATVPPCITAMRSLMPRTSGSSDEIMRIASPRRRGHPSAGGSRPWRRRRRLASARRGSAREGSVASHRASATFCWLPPERADAASIAAAVPRAPGRSARPTPLAAGVEDPSRRDSAGARPAYVWPDRHRDHAVAAAVLGHVGDAERDGRGRGEPIRAVDPDLAGVGRRQAEHRPRQLGPPGADEPGQAEDLAGPDGKVTPRTPARRPQVASPAARAGARPARGRPPRARGRP